MSDDDSAADADIDEPTDRVDSDDSDDSDESINRVDADDSENSAGANDRADAEESDDIAEAPDPDDPVHRLDVDGVARQRPIYTESQVIMTTVKVMIPFVLTYGLFITFHGADTPGGGFQGGAIIASVVLMIAFAFGIESTRAWLPNSLVVGLGTGGVLLFGAIGFGPVVLGENFLEYTAYYPVFGSLLGLKEYEFVKYGMEAVEIVGIAFIVSGILMGLFFALAAGFTPVEMAEDGVDAAVDDADREATTEPTAGTTAGSTETAGGPAEGGPTDD